MYVCFLYPLVNGHIDCFHTLAVGTDVAMSWGVQSPEAWSKLFPHAETPPSDDIAHLMADFLLEMNPH